MKKIKIMLLMILINLGLFAFDKVSFELDVLPYVTGGNYFGVGFANNGLNYRFIKASVNLPNFILPDNIESVTMDVYTIIVDYFFRGNEYEGPWVGLGYEFWDSKIKEEGTNVENDLTQHILTLGAGYVFKLSDHFYINPWAAIHYDLNGNTEKVIGSTEYKPNRITPEASLKFGYCF